jgi:hypothetical protein
MKPKAIKKLNITKQTINNLQLLAAIKGGTGCMCDTGDSCGIVCYNQNDYQ